jgi:glycosyltransferase involved in cell wall biosynthesis
VRTLVIIPTYQEALNIAEAVGRARRACPRCDVLVVDDSSPDGTAAIARDAGAEVLVRPVREGLGPAYRQAWRWAMDHGYDAVVDMDADGSHDPAAIPSLLQPLEAGADLVMGSRYVPGGAVPGWPAHRLLVSRVGNVYARVVLGLPVHDATGGYRAYRVELLRRIDLASLRANGYGFQIELAYRAVRLGAKVVEVPITFVDRTLGHSKMSGGIVGEALLLVTWWGVRDRLLRRRDG